MAISSMGIESKCLTDGEQLGRASVGQQKHQNNL